MANAIENYDVIWWVNAETKNSLMKAYRGFAKNSRIGLRVVEGEWSIVQDAVKGWFDDNKDKRFLVIFDNVDFKNKEAFDELSSNLPPRGCGHVLITTRDEEVWKNLKAEKVDVTEFKPEEAVDFLEKRLEPIPKPF